MNVARLQLCGEDEIHTALPATDGHNLVLWKTLAYRREREGCIGVVRDQAACNASLRLRGQFVCLRANSAHIFPEALSHLKQDICVP